MRESGEVRPITSARATVDAKALISLSNVYAAEEADGCAIRWTGPGSVFSIYLPVDRQYAWSVNLICVNSVGPFNWDNVFVECEEDMVLCQHRKLGRQHHLSCNVAAASNMTGAILRFHLQETRRMRPPVFGEADKRILGLCVKAVELQRI